MKFVKPYLTKNYDFLAVLIVGTKMTCIYRERLVLEYLTIYVEIFLVI